MFDRLGMPGIRPTPWWLWKGVFGFQTSLNEGALFGMWAGPLAPVCRPLGRRRGGHLRLAVSVGAARDWLLTIALAFVTAGILGNLYDRLGLPGLVWPRGYRGHPPGAAVHAVRDFIP